MHIACIQLTCMCADTHTHITPNVHMHILKHISHTIHIPCMLGNTTHHIYQQAICTTHTKHPYLQYHTTHNMHTIVTTETYIICNILHTSPICMLKHNMPQSICTSYKLTTLVHTIDTHHTHINPTAHAQSTSHCLSQGSCSPCLYMILKSCVPASFCLFWSSLRAM